MTVYCDLEMDTETALELLGFLQLHRESTPALAPLFHVPVAQLKEFKHYSWRPLSSYVHGGIHAVNRHGRGFPLELVCMQVRHSNGPLGLVGSLLLVMAGLSPEQQVMAKLFEEFEACFPPVSV